MPGLPAEATATRTLVALAALIIILAGVKTAEAVVAPFLIAIFIAAISAPLMFILTDYRVPQGLALLIVMLVIVAFGLLLSSMMGASLDGFSKNLPLYQQRLTGISVQLVGFLSGHGITVEASELKRLLDLSAVMGLVGSTFNRVLGTLANTFLILLTVAFILMELGSFKTKVMKISRSPVSALAHFEHFSSTLNRYIVIKSMMSLLTALVVLSALLILDVDYPVMWAILAFLLNFVPNIGSIVAAIPAVLLALIQHGPDAAGILIAVYFGVNNIVGNIIEPKLMGRSLGLSSLVVFVSLVFWGWLLGPIGMFLSVPLTMTVKIAAETDEKSRWLADLLGCED
ncbi:putative PurR-regulated permease PerM [Sinobacterium caligoides]|uniref:Putative PurR-regulated permease PerM n=1 Tax=Sinobacterium caligoides TaxID=933926 RepID=A0A3N2DP30_9GAMM|nr:AI-2E family transporter [Sinobacterium caligoides]ROS01557.1 putative PurR-regulated permease PerM [Sinobacterium caligoides]